jgi:hypothetical protein
MTKNDESTAFNDKVTLMMYEKLQGRVIMAKNDEPTAATGWFLTLRKKKLLLTLHFVYTPG